jgi:hypothetical protein
LALITANERENPDRWEPINCKVFGFQSGGGGSRGVASRSADIFTGDARKHAHALELFRFEGMRSIFHAIKMLPHRHGENRCSAIKISPLLPLPGHQGKDPSKSK